MRVCPERIDEVRHLLLETNPDYVRVELGTPTYRCQGTAVAYGVSSTGHRNGIGQQL